MAWVAPRNDKRSNSYMVEKLKTTHNVEVTPTCTSSNVVLLEMMMHYKRRMEIAESETERAKKRVKVMEQVHWETVSQQQETIQTQNAANDMLRQANIRGAQMVMRKHEAGMRLMACMDDLFNDIELSYGAKAIEERRGSDEYLMYMKERAVQRAGTAFELLIHEYDELEAMEEIDLTETTDEETDTEDEVEI